MDNGAASVFRFSKPRALDSGASLFFEVNGFSMWPFLKSGQKVIARKTPAQDFKIGDLILYKFDNQVICHRLIKKNSSNIGYGFYLRGDLSLSAPEKVDEELFLGRVCGVIKDNRILIVDTKIQQLINRVIVIIAPLIAGLVRFGEKYILRRRRLNGDEVK